MKTINTLLMFALLLSICPASVMAQSANADHPLLSDDFYVSVGAYIPTKDFKIRVSGRTTRSGEIDFEEAFDIKDSQTTGAGELRWRFGEKWSVSGQYWTVSDSATAVLTEDIEWEDVVFKEGTFADAGVGLDVARVFFGRTFSTGPQYEFGAGAGFHWLELSAYIGGQIKTDLGDTDPYRGSVDASAPLPNIGAWYNYAWSPKWALSARVDWLSASVGDYSGSLWNAKIGLNWAFVEHFGVSASWNYFKLDVDVDKSDWRGSAEISHSGPFVALTAYW